MVSVIGNSTYVGECPSHEDVEGDEGWFELEVLPVGEKEMKSDDFNFDVFKSDVTEFFRNLFLTGDIRGYRVEDGIFNTLRVFVKGLEPAPWFGGEFTRLDNYKTPINYKLSL